MVHQLLVCMRVCVIDDNTSITSMFTKLAKIKGHDCVIANDGRTGLSLLENEIYDAVMLDLAMPEFSGIDVVNSLEKNGMMDKQKILILTASSISDDDIENIKMLGVKAVLKKPVKLDDLLTILENIAIRS